MMRKTKSNRAYFNSRGYVTIQRLLHGPTLAFLQTYSSVLFGAGKFTRDPQCSDSLSIYGDPAFDALLEHLRRRIERSVGFELVPTFSFARLYGKGEVLPKHTDRPSCEISASIALKVPPKGPPSILWLGMDRGGPKQVELREGDACIYAGTRIEHWRTPLPEHGYLQLFLHYISRHGAHHPGLRYDRRPVLGLPVTSRKGP